MWFLFHRRAGTKTVEDGKSFTEECPTCQRETRFEEIEISAKYGVWFVDLIGDSERAFRCTRCGDTFDLEDPGATAAPKPTPAPAVATKQDAQARAERVEQLAAEQRRRDAEAAKQRAKLETKLDDELAELKKRVGR